MTGSLTASGMKSICVPLLQKGFFVSSDLIYHILGTFLKKKSFYPRNKCPANAKIKS